MKIVSASFALYLLLSVASLGVRLGTRRHATSQLRLQIDAWWWIFPIVSVAISIYPYGLPLLSVLIGGLAARELSVFTGSPRQQFILQFTCFVGVVVSSAAGAFPIVGSSMLLVLVIARKAVRLVWLLLLLTASGVGIIGCFAMLPLEESAARSWVFYLFVLTALNDIGQFVAGKLFGRTRIAPAISPNKTVQGLVGGVAVSVAVSLFLGAWLGLAQPPRLILYAVLLSTSGFLGDLLFSAVKRSLGIKDFSGLIPGHGGILDRVDSLVFTAPLLYFLLQKFE